MRKEKSYQSYWMPVLLLAGAAFIATPAGASDGFYKVNGSAVFGGAIGGGAGAAVGSAVGGRNGAIIGSAVGAAAGVAIATPQRPVAVRYYEDHHHDHGWHRGHNKHHYHKHDHDRHDHDD